MVEVFGFQIFVSGLVHCDPHPGNIMVCAEVWPNRDEWRCSGEGLFVYIVHHRHWLIFAQVRKQPNGEQQLVLLDHGLYIQESEKFREAYCRLWKAIFFMDVDTMAEICKSWGIRYVCCGKDIQENDLNLIAASSNQPRCTGLGPVYYSIMICFIPEQQHK